MNARQKAKYWKRKYQELANQSVNINYVSNYRIETLCCTRVVDDRTRVRQIMTNSGIQKVILDEVINGVAEEAKRFVDITTERDIYNGGMRITGRLSIAMPSAYVRRRMEEIL